VIDRQGVKKLISDDDGRTGWQSIRISGERWAARRVVLVSTRWIRSPSRNSGTIATERSISAISVPRPGPSSISNGSAGLPIICHTTTAHSPMISPNI
jgi:hypothetical protein